MAVIEFGGPHPLSLSRVPGGDLAGVGGATPEKERTGAKGELESRIGSVGNLLCVLRPLR